MGPTGMPVVALPTPGVVGGRPRKQPLVDTEVLAGTTAIPSEINIFSNFSQFRVAPVVNTNITQTKQYGRDTNLKSSGGGTLPQSSFFYWYKSRIFIKTYLTALNTSANCVAYEEIQRLRFLGAWFFNFQQTELIVMPLDELPSGCGSAFGSSTLNSINQPSLVNGPWEGRDVTVSGRPVGIEALQQFVVQCKWPQTTGFTPTLDYYVSARLDGLLLLGIS